MTEEKKLNDDELENATGGAKYNLSAEKAENVGAFGEQTGTQEGTGTIEPHPVVSDKDLQTVRGGVKSNISAEKAENRSAFNEQSEALGGTVGTEPNPINHDREQ